MCVGQGHKKDGLIRLLFLGLNTNRLQMAQSFCPPSALLVLAGSGQVEAQKGHSPCIREKEEEKGRTLEKHLEATVYLEVRCSYGPLTPSYRHPQLQPGGSCENCKALLRALMRTSQSPQSGVVEASWARGGDKRMYVTSAGLLTSLWAAGPQACHRLCTLRPRHPQRLSHTFESII